MAARLIEGRRKRGKVLVVDEYKYQKKRNTAHAFNWRCWRYPACTASIRTNQFNLQAVQPHIQVRAQVAVHTHPPDENEIARSEFTQRLREKVSTTPGLPPKRVFEAQVVAEHQRIGRQGGGDRPDIPSFESVRTLIQRERARHIPQIPQTVDDVDVQGEWAETWLSDRFLLHNDPQWGILIFATDECIRKLMRCGTIFVDATFRSCPRPYTQVLTILGDVDGHTIPLVHALMEQRTVGHYRQVLIQIKRAARRLRRANEWQTVVCDFETAIHAAFGTEFPRPALQGCYFHFSQK